MRRADGLRSVGKPTPYPHGECQQSVGATQVIAPQSGSTAKIQKCDSYPTTRHSVLPYVHYLNRGWNTLAPNRLSGSDAIEYSLMEEGISNVQSHGDLSMGWRNGVAGARERINKRTKNYIAREGD